MGRVAIKTMTFGSDKHFAYLWKDEDDGALSLEIECSREGFTDVEDVKDLLQFITMAYERMSAKSFADKLKRDQSEPAWNEEIERRIEKEAHTFAEKWESPFDKDEFPLGLGFQEGAKWMLSLSSELKAQRPDNSVTQYCLACEHTKHTCGIEKLVECQCIGDSCERCDPNCRNTPTAPKPVDESLDNAAQGHDLKIKYPTFVKSFKAGVSYQAPISEAIGEAKGIKWAIEILDNCGCNDFLKEEAKRRGIKL